MKNNNTQMLKFNFFSSNLKLYHGRFHNTFPPMLQNAILQNTHLKDLACLVVEPL